MLRKKTNIFWHYNIIFFFYKHLQIIDQSMPTFDKQFYSFVVKENIELFSALPIDIKAESALKRSLMYSIANESINNCFEIDYRTGKKVKVYMHILYIK